MELFPNLEIGLFNGWILIVLFFGAYGIILIFFPQNAIARLYDRSGQRKHHLIRRLFVVILVLLWLILVSLTPLKIGDVVFVIGISIYSLGLIGFMVALIISKIPRLISQLQVGSIGSHGILSNWPSPYLSWG